MNRILVALLAFATLGVVAAGCGSDSDPPAASARSESTTAATAAFDPATALIALEDLPTGWAEDPPEDDDDSPEFCGDEIDRSGFESVDSADAGFAQGGTIPVLVHTVAAYEPSDAALAMSSLRQAAEACTTFKNDEGTEFAVARGSFPAVGDESVALIVNAEIEGFTVTLYMVVLRVGDAIALVAYGGIGPDVAEAERFVRLAESKLRAAQS